jgi:Tfp pilus assembly protein PilZ
LANISERRKNPRIEAKWPVILITDRGEFAAKTTNITVDGLFVKCNQQLILNEVVRMSIKPPDHDAMEMSGKVIWSESYFANSKNIIYGVGICFVEIADRDWRFFEHLVSKYLSSEDHQ